MKESPASPWFLACLWLLFCCLGHAREAETDRAGGGLKTFTGSRPYSGDLGVLWEVLTDYESAPRFQPGVLKSSLVSVGEDGVKRIEQELRQGFLIFQKRIRIVLQIREQPETRIDFTLVEGEFDVYEGSWIIELTGLTPQLQLNLRVDPAFAAPDFILESIVRNAGEKSLRSILEEAYRRDSQTGSAQE